MGSIGARENSTGRSSRISGEVDYATIRGAAGGNVVNFDKITTIQLRDANNGNRVTYDTVRKVGDMVNTVVYRNPDQFVGTMWQDKRGAKFLQQLSSAGYGIQAHATVTPAQGNIPEKRAYLFVKVGAKRK